MRRRGARARMEENQPLKRPGEGEKLGRTCCRQARRTNKRGRAWRRRRRAAVTRQRPIPMRMRMRTRTQTRTRRPSPGHGASQSLARALGLPGSLPSASRSCTRPDRLAEIGTPAQFLPPPTARISRKFAFLDLSTLAARRSRSAIG